MSIELMIFLAMVVVFAGGCFLLKLPVSISMVLSSVVGALVGGQGSRCGIWWREPSPMSTPSSSSQPR